ncbi:pyridoxamine 5'-phosphate oxidase family protein [Luteococcus peritonei]|uniref:Pyridoxamine 5'-phosphate oxidase family protein n=1 Tax=Luteococcus peritonei TaxID=88874 RepID=A0ABW4RTY8_9ACTN
MSDKTIDDVLDMLQAERVAMLTTHDEDELVSRPMGLQHVDRSDNSLWFFVNAGSDKALQVTEEAHVNLAFAGDDYLSVSGTATVVRDQARIEELWNSFAEAMLDREPTDPAVALLRVAPTTIAYWETPSSPRFLLGVAKSMLGGSRPQGGDHGVVEA